METPFPVHGNWSCALGPCDTTSPYPLWRWRSRKRWAVHQASRSKRHSAVGRQVVVQSSFQAIDTWHDDADADDDDDDDDIGINHDIGFNLSIDIGIIFIINWYWFKRMVSLIMMIFLLF